MISLVQLPPYLTVVNTGLQVLMPVETPEIYQPEIILISRN